jgi:hypothetical protein
MSYELTGTIKSIAETQSFASGFTKRQFVVTTDDDKYPQDIPLEFVKDGCARLDAYDEGDGCKVSFNIRGNEYNGKHYVQLSAWKIEKTDGGLGVRSPEYGKQDSHNQAKSNGYQPQRATSQNGAPPPTAGGHSDHDEDDFESIPF